MGWAEDIAFCVSELRFWKTVILRCGGQKDVAFCGSEFEILGVSGLSGNWSAMMDLGDGSGWVRFGVW